MVVRPPCLLRRVGAAVRAVAVVLHLTLEAALGGGSDQRCVLEDHLAAALGVGAYPNLY